MFIYVSAIDRIHCSVCSNVSADDVLIEVNARMMLLLIALIGVNAYTSVINCTNPYNCS